MREWELVYKSKDYLENKYLDYSLEFAFYNLLVDFVGIDNSGDFTFVEFKVKNWVKVLQQAYKHMRFVNYNYICMPDGNSIKKLQAEGRLQKLGIGLISVGDKDIKEIIKAKRKDLHPLFRNILIKDWITLNSPEWIRFKLDFDGIEKFHKENYLNKLKGEPR